MEQQSADSNSIQNQNGILKEAAYLLNHRLRVCLVDGRILVGDFTCLDKQGNIILFNTYEELPSISSTINKEKLMGQVLIPADQRVSIHIQAMPFEADKVKTILDMKL